MPTIKNGKDTPLNAKAGTVPQMEGALKGWYQPMIFIPIGKFLDSGFVQETGTPINFRGVLTPYKPTQLEIKKQGQRKWKWWSLIATTELQLTVDDALAYLNNQMRCMSSEDWSLEGFMKYVLIQDYLGTIQNLVYDTDGSLTTDGNQSAPEQVVTDPVIQIPPSPGNPVNE